MQPWMNEGYSNCVGSLFVNVQQAEQEQNRSLNGSSRNVCKITVALISLMCFDMESSLSLSVSVSLVLTKPRFLTEADRGFSASPTWAELRLAGVWVINAVFDLFEAQKRASDWHHSASASWTASRPWCLLSLEHCSSFCWAETAFVGIITIKIHHVQLWIISKVLTRNFIWPASFQ